MATYDPLREYLGRQQGDSCELTFDEIEEVIGARLPDVALYTREWWANEPHPEAKHVQANAWMGIGWRVGMVNMTKMMVRFVRNRDDR